MSSLRQASVVFLVCLLGLAIGLNNYSSQRVVSSFVYGRKAQPKMYVLSKLRGGSEVLSEHLTEDARLTIGANDTAMLTCRDPKSGIRYDFYIAFWDRENIYRMESHLHTPDTCWDGVGWEMTKAQLASRVFLGDIPIDPVEQRIFRSPEGVVEYVVFFPMEGAEIVPWSGYVGESAIIGMFRRSGVIANLKQSLTRLTDNSSASTQAPHFFVRVNSRVPISLWHEIDSLGASLRKIKKLGTEL